MPDILKIFIGVVLYFVVAPVYGLLCSSRPKWITMNLGITAFFTTIAASRWTLQVMSVEWYRGHTRGFEINFLVALSMSSIIAMMINRQYKVKLIPPGMGMYLLFIAMSSLSIVNAVDKSFTLMAIFKFSSMGLIFVMAFNAIRTAKDLRVLQNAIALALIWQFLLVLKLKYVDGVYRAQGAFPHSNNLGMYAYMTGLYMLGVIQQSKPKFSRFVLLAVAYICAVALALVTISRASFVAAILGSAVLMGLSVIIRPAAKKIAVAIALMIPVVLGVAVVSDQLIARSTQDAETTGEGTFRGALEKQAQAMLYEEPLGIGWNNFCLATNPLDGRYAPILDAYFVEARGYLPTHVEGEQSALIENLYWMILGETGYPAFFVFVGFLLLFFSYVVRTIFYFRTSELGASPLALAVVLPVLYLHSYVERILVDTPVLVMFLLFLAVAARLFSFKQQIKKGELTLAQVLD